jgi:hypothetical protein
MTTTKRRHPESRSDHRRAGSHPVGTGVGAAGGAATGAAIGAAGGPAGALAGAAVGAVVGGLAGKGVAEMIDPTVEEAYWRDNFASRPYASGSTFDDYARRTRYGWETYPQFAGVPFEEVEPQLRSQWAYRRGDSDLDWDRAKFGREGLVAALERHHRARRSRATRTATASKHAQQQECDGRARAAVASFGRAVECRRWTSARSEHRFRRRAARLGRQRVRLDGGREDVVRRARRVRRRRLRPDRHGELVLALGNRAITAANPRAVIGRWIARRGRHDDVVIATKVGSDMGLGRKCLRREHIVEQADASLKRLQVERIDLYQSHWDDPDTPLDETSRPTSG